MKSFFVGAILGGIGGIVGGYFGLARGPSLRVKELRTENEKLSKGAKEAKEARKTAEGKLAEAVDRERKAKENYGQDLKKQQEAHKHELERLQGDVTTAKRDAENFRKKLVALEEEARKARAATGSVPVIARLVALRDKHRPVEVAVARDLVKARMLLSRARESIPETEKLRAVARRLGEKTSALSESTKKLFSYVSQNSTALKEAGIDPPVQMQDLSNQELKLVQAAVEAVVDAAAGIRSAKAQVYADKEWQEADVSALKGDYIFVKGLRKSKWSMKREFGPKSGERAIAGWDQHYDAKQLTDAKSGSLIMRVGLSEEMWPAYELRPIVAEAIGTVYFRMNDRLPEGNWGKAYIEVTAVPGERLEGALAGIEEALKEVTWLKW